MRAVVATHAVYRYGNQLDLDRFTSRNARATCVPCAILALMNPRERVIGDSWIMPLCCAIGQPKAGELLFALGLDDHLAAIEAVRADMMTQVDFAGRWFHRQRRVGEEIMRTVHAALGRRFLVLLDCHELLLKFEFIYCRFSADNELKGEFFSFPPSKAKGDEHSPG